MKDLRIQSLFFIALSLLCLHFAGPSGSAQARVVAVKAPLSFQQYNEQAARIDEKKHTVDLDKFLELRKKKDTVVVDLRSQEEYDREHIEGAIRFGADISKENLEKMIPSKDSTILMYCAYSLMPVRMIALTNVSLPQFILQGYKNSYKLAPIWMGHDQWQDTEKQMARLPMVKKSQVEKKE